MFNDRTGKKFNRWTVLKFVGIKKCRDYWLCRCDCGTEKVVIGVHLSSNQSKSCGCLQRERVSRYENAGHPLYGTWSRMILRCTDPNQEVFKHYGGRGIKVCDEWLGSFDKFLEDMGERPEGRSLDRIDNDGDYTPENCRWATNVEQRRNMRSNNLLTYNGATLCVSEWAQKLGLTYSAIKHRLNAGWSVEKTLTTPLKGV